ncbi:MAG: hypothetical protein IK090_00150 [Clostridia bacterium]|nr:hypothetical protein [Clostridia bacterium]
MKNKAFRSLLTKKKKEVENLRFSPISFQGAFSILVLSLSEYKVHLRVENENPASKMPVSFLSSAEFCADRKAREKGK